ncbi:Oligopeptide transport system permease protein AppC [Geodia barretti]|uniref:Oligopeptide transport system permease protein AppC n=1 Tax=Geodia barretti TaxID=519541 RepID=A0AA35RHF3_GEOBA|nr:Oligopeptide transport system permease protein AppC [Geodia barretti]
MSIFLIGVDQMMGSIHFGDRVAWIWRSNAHHNLLLIALIAAAILLIRYASRQEYWRNAARQVRGRRLAMVSFAILSVYVLAGLLDSIRWGDPVLNPDGKLVRNEVGGLIYSPRSTIQQPDGRVSREYPALQHPRSHLFGTDKVGTDVFYRALKGIRTALIIGGFTTLTAIPFALCFGVVAGYFGGRVDDIVQYIYSTLASIPSILLIVAFMLLFGHGLFNLCLILGISSWTGLCRLLRGETLKLRELEYIQAAEAFGIGVDPTTGSWGNMINTARLELARDPVVWWNLIAAFLFMFGLVLPANLFGDAVRDALRSAPTNGVEKGEEKWKL